MVVKFDGGGASAATVTDVFTKLRATEITTPTLIATTADINGGTIDNSVIGGSTAAAVTGTAVVANTSLNIAGDGATVTGIKDEDDMSSDSPTKLATQQSIKAYVDSQVGTVDTWAEVLANGATSGSTSPEVTSGQVLKTNTINETTSTSGVTVDGVLLKDGGGTFTSALDVQSTITGDGLTIDGLTTLDMGASTGVGLTIESDNNDSVTGPHLKINAGRAATGAFSFFQLANSGGTVLNVSGRGDFTLTPTASGAAVFNSGNVDADFQVRGVSDSNMLFVDAANSRVGVGTGSPSTKFHLHGAAGSPPELTISEGGARSVIQTTRNADNNGDLRFKTEILGSIDTRMLISYLGNVGIENTSPDGLLSLGSTTTTSAILNFKTTKSTFAITPSNTDAGGTTLETSFVAGGHGPMIFRTVGAESMRLSAGAVFNNDLADQDFTVKSVGNSHMLFVNAADSHVNIGTVSDLGQVLNVNGGVGLGTDPTVTWTSNYLKFQTRSASVPVVEFLASASGNYAPRIDIMNGAGTVQHRIDAANATTFNLTNADNDFTVESVGNSHMLHVDAANSRVGIGDNTPSRSFSVQGASDFFFAGNNTNGGTIRLGSSRSNNVTQYGVINMRQYNFTNEPEGYMMIGGTAADGISYVNIGGGVDEQNMATDVRIFAGPDSNTRSSGVTGLRVFIDNDQIYLNSSGEAVDFRYDSDAVGKALFYNSSANTMEIGGASSGSVGDGRLKVVSPSIGTSVNDRLRLQQWYYGTGNGSFFTLKARREAANGVWTGVVTDFVLEVDNSADIYTYQTFGIGRVAFNDFQSADVDFYVKTDTMNKLFINASEDEMTIVLGTAKTNGVQFTDGSSERLNINYNGSQKVNLYAQSAPGGADADVFSISSYRNNTQRDAIVISRNGSIRENPGVANNASISGNNRHRVRYFHAGANFNNPTMTIGTITASGSYPQAIFKVTIYSSGLSANATGISVGYVTLECDTPYTTWQKVEQAFAFEFNNYGSTVPTWNITTSSNTATIAITCNRMTNYDGFYAEVEALVVNSMDVTYASS